MKALPVRLGLALVVFAASLMAFGQSSPSPSPEPAAAAAPAASVPAAAAAVLSDAPAIPVPTVTPAVQMLRDFKDSDVKFDVELMMNLLRDRNHEGWVLAAYPDPRTGQPLIGAGVSIDLPAREHPQRDPLNSHPFIEPSSAELWQAAGLDSDRLNQILADFHDRLTVWSTKDYRQHISDLPSQISEEESMQLLRIAIVQSILNARAYCRSFDQLTPSQQMAVSQLVFQMGTNLEEFTQFLGLINSDAIAAPMAKKVSASDMAYWKSVQQSLEQSQWARLYRLRAISVIAMLDPRYSQSPVMAERRVGAVLRPAVVHRRRGHSSGSTQLASGSKSSGPHAGKRTHRARSRRKA